MILLEIWSDPICPWCFIGKARLDRALEQRPEHPFELRWHPFQLNPDMPPEGMDRTAYLDMKFGARGVLDAYRPVIEAAEDSGLALNLPRIERTPNTVNAHRLIHWAGLEGRQSMMVNRLFRAYFQEGRDIGNSSELIRLGKDAGLDENVVARLLDTDADIDAIRQADRLARSRGITGVPFFILDKSHAISGAQPTDLWVQVIDQIMSGRS